MRSSGIMNAARTTSHGLLCLRRVSSSASAASRCGQTSAPAVTALRWRKSRRFTMPRRSRDGSNMSGTLRVTQGARGSDMGALTSDDMESTIRFLKQYLRPTDNATVESETIYTRGAEALPATVFRPARGPRQLPGWVVLHGLTRPGRAHPSLQRFARAFAS